MNVTSYKKIPADFCFLESTTSPGWFLHFEGTEKESGDGIYSLSKGCVGAAVWNNPIDAEIFLVSMTATNLKIRKCSEAIEQMKKARE